MSKPKYGVVIRYKSGAEVRVRVDDLDVHWDRSTGQVTKFTWENMQPNPIMIGLHSVESVWMDE